MNIKKRKDWFGPALIVSLAAHCLVFLFLPDRIVKDTSTSTLIIRSMAFIKKDVVNSIRTLSVSEVDPANSAGHSPLDKIDQREIIDVMAALPEKEDKSKPQDKKLKLSERVERRPEEKSDDSHGFLELIRERISASCKKHMEGRISIPGPQRMVVLSVTILPSGKLESVEVIESSNLPLIDNASIEAVKLAAPFPRFPNGFDRPSLKVRVPIRITL